MDSVTSTGKACRWSKEEVSTLIRLVTQSIGIIKGKFSQSLTNDDKNKCWDSITEKETTTENIAGRGKRPRWNNRRTIRGERGWFIY